MPLSYTIEENELKVKVFRNDLHTFLKTSLGLPANYNIISIEQHGSDSSAYKILVHVA